MVKRLLSENFEKQTESRASEFLRSAKKQHGGLINLRIIKFTQNRPTSIKYSLGNKQWQTIIRIKGF